jgi:hypothetical protein
MHRHHLSAQEMTARASIKYRELLPIDDLAIFAALQAAQTDVTVEIDINDREISLGTMSQDAPDAIVGWTGLDLAIEAIRKIAASAARTLPSMSIDQLNKSAAQLNVLGAFLSDRNMLLKFTPFADAPRKFSCLLGYSVATVGKLRLGAIVRRPITSDKRHGKRRHIFFGPANLVRSYVAPEGSLAEQTIYEDYQCVLDELSTNGEVLGLGDICELVNGTDGEREIPCDLPSSREVHSSEKS